MKFEYYKGFRSYFKRRNTDWNYWVFFQQEFSDFVQILISQRIATYSNVFFIWILIYTEILFYSQVLLQAINYIVKNSEGLDEFVAISKLFREGSYYPTAFYADCKIILGDKFDIVFPELLALLPDIPKQQVSIDCINIIVNLNNWMMFISFFRAST